MTPAPSFNTPFQTDKSSTVFPKYRILFYSWFRDSRELQSLARLGLGVYRSVSAVRRK